MKALFLVLLVLSISSCGKKTVMNQPATMGFVDSITAGKSLPTDKSIGDVSCIDDLLSLYLGNSSSAELDPVDSDVSFCNGLRVRIKIFKIKDSGVIKVFGFAEGTHRQKTCLKEGKDFKYMPFLGVHGTLVGNGIKISMGGHTYTAAGKLVPKKGLLKKYVKFDLNTFDGEVGFFQDDKLVCWGNNPNDASQSAN